MPAVSFHRVFRLLTISLLAAVAGLAVSSAHAENADKTHRQVIVPQEDRFTPFALTIRSGESVEWINMDTDDHTVVSDDFFNTAGHNGTDVLIPGTDNNHGKPGTFRLHFEKPGTFVYYCKFHSHLDDAHQPAAPGPRGGIQDSHGNFGTPMMGVITVVSGDRGQD
ncbi:MAG TPA: cupredoxin domain-containing protein [Thermoanaerobaculia bacterium]|nr:cupredoxin domain-containing protein [Thermoanaerobaculia bacterium]